MSEAAHRQKEEEHERMRKYNLSHYDKIRDQVSQIAIWINIFKSIFQKM